MRREARTFQVSGMHCAGCVGKVEAALGELPGVVRVAVSLEPGLARVDFDGDRASPDAIARAITGLGYQVEIRLEGEAALDREQELRQAEFRRQTRWMLVAWPLALVVMAGTFREYEHPESFQAEAKAQEVARLQAEGARVAMVRDGINDAPALAQADLGIAIGSGTDVAKETGHVVLIKEDLRDVVVALEVARATMRKVKENLFWAFAYNTLAIPIGAGLLYPFVRLLVSPELAAVLMAVSSLTVTLNTLLLKRFIPPSKRGAEPRPWRAGSAA